MKFLADENFARPVVVAIKKLGYSVKTIQQKNLQGSSDETVTNIALKEKRIVLTFDKDFLKNQPRNLQAVVFEFPKVPTTEIIPVVEKFLIDLSNIKTKDKIFIFSKRGLEIMNYHGR